MEKHGYEWPWDVSRTEGDRIILSEASAGPGDDPFATFNEWRSEADREGYASFSSSRSGSRTSLTSSAQLNALRKPRARRARRRGPNIRTRG